MFVDVYAVVIADFVNQTENILFSVILQQNINFFNVKNFKF